jgi:hypothetical protein
MLWDKVAPAKRQRYGHSRGRLCHTGLVPLHMFLTHRFPTTLNLYLNFGCDGKAAAHAKGFF